MDKFPMNLTIRSQDKTQILEKILTFLNLIKFNEKSYF